MKKAIVEIGLLITGSIGVSTQRIVDTLFIIGNTRAGNSFNPDIEYKYDISNHRNCALHNRLKAGQKSK